MICDYNQSIRALSNPEVLCIVIIIRKQARQPMTANQYLFSGQNWQLNQIATLVTLMNRIDLMKVDDPKLFTDK